MSNQRRVFQAILMTVVLSSALYLAGCGPSEAELREDQFGVVKVENRKITGKEKTAAGNYFLKSGRKYCKLGVTQISPVSDFDRLGRGDFYDCVWTYRRADF